MRAKWGISDKTFWDWLQLLVIPLILAVGGFWFSAQQSTTSLQSSERQHGSDQAIALEQQHAALLQTYMDNIQDLLLHDNLGKSKSTDDVAILARARTLTAVQGLDPNRKGLLVQFLYEAHLIGFLNKNFKLQPAIIALNNAILDSANLQFTFLRGVDFRGAILEDADLENADLAYATLGCIDVGPTVGTSLSQCALLAGANLSEANLSKTTMGATAFIDANFKHANLSDANLSESFDLSQEQLDQVDSCEGAILPERLVCHRNSFPFRLT